MKFITTIIFILFSFPVYSMGNALLGIEKDMVRITIQDGIPCFYLKENNRIIKGIVVTQFTDRYNLIWSASADELYENKGNIVNSCVLFGNGKMPFKYNEPYRILVKDNFSKSYRYAYRLDICILYQNEKYYIVKTNYINKAEGHMTCKSLDKEK